MALRLSAITAIITTATAIAVGVAMGGGVGCVFSVAVALGVYTSVGSVECRARSVIMTVSRFRSPSPVLSV